MNEDQDCLRCTTANTSAKPISPVQSFNYLIEHLHKLMESVTHAVNACEKCAELSPRPESRHLTFIRTKSIQLVQSKFLDILRSTQLILAKLFRYRRLIERVLFDIRSDVKLNGLGLTIRERSQAQKGPDDVGEIMKAESKALRNVKWTLEVHLGQLVTVIGELSQAQHGLLSIVELYRKSLNTAERQLKTTLPGPIVKVPEQPSSSMSKTEQMLWEPNLVMRSIDEACEHAMVLRNRLDSMFTRIARFLRSTKDAVHDTLMSDSAEQMNVQRLACLAAAQQKIVRNHCMRVTHRTNDESSKPNRMAEKSLQQELGRVLEAQALLDSKAKKARHVLQANLQVTRMRRREFKRRLYPDMRLEGFAVAESLGAQKVST
ncbi:unnamed protein product [Dicrocoelium dendriticum]|nr:unnamed protein product [Dicrocoelium dendriticum]